MSTSYITIVNNTLHGQHRVSSENATTNRETPELRDQNLRIAHRKVIMVNTRRQGGYKVAQCTGARGFDHV
jgi:hypothetical protein